MNNLFYYHKHSILQYIQIDFIHFNKRLISEYLSLTENSFSFDKYTKVSMFCYNLEKH